MKRWFIFIAIATIGMNTLAQKGIEKETAVFGAGCFWCVEAFYEEQSGVLDVVPGYAGGKAEDATYEKVSTGDTGHVEVIQVEFDPSKISYEKLVDFFWKTHDPTNAEGVWPDFGPQYRSMIYYKDDNQKKIAEASKEKAQKEFKRPIATKIVPLEKFYVAEKYHHDYVKENPDAPYVRNVAIPKMEKLKKK